MGQSSKQRAALAVLGAVILRATRTGALVGLVPGALASLVIVVTRDGPLGGQVLVGALIVAVLGLGLGLLLCLSAFLGSLPFVRLEGEPHPLVKFPLRLERSLLGVGAAGFSVGLVVLAVMLWQYERLS